MCRQMLTKWSIIALSVICALHNTSCESTKEVASPEHSAQKRFTLNYHDLVQSPKSPKSETKRFTLNFHDLYSNEDLKRFYIRPTSRHPADKSSSLGSTSPKYYLRHYYSGPVAYWSERDQREPFKHEPKQKRFTMNHRDLLQKRDTNDNDDDDSHGETKRFTMNHEDLIQGMGKRFTMNYHDLEGKRDDDLSYDKRFTMNYHDLLDQNKRGDHDSNKNHHHAPPQKRFTLNHEDLAKRSLLTPIELNNWMAANWAKAKLKVPADKRFTMNHHDLEKKQAALLEDDELLSSPLKRFTMNYQDLTKRGQLQGPIPSLVKSWTAEGDVDTGRSKRFTMNYLDLENPKQKTIKRVSRETYRNKMTHPISRMVSILTVLDHLITRAVEDRGLDVVCGNPYWRDMIQSRDTFSLALDLDVLENCPD